LVFQTLFQFSIFRLWQVTTLFISSCCSFPNTSLKTTIFGGFCHSFSGFPLYWQKCVVSSCLRVQDTARDLGVVIDSRLSLSAHVAAVYRSSYYQLRPLRPAVRSLSEDASKTLVQAFVSCHLDFCNCLFFGISHGRMGRLQSVQNAAARLVTGSLALGAATT